MTKPILLITGANSGLGFETVRKVLESTSAQAKTGYHIILCGRSQQRAQDAVDKLKNDFPGSNTEIRAMTVDIASDESIAGLAKAIDSEYGKLDILVNNAGAQFDAEFTQGRMSERDMWNKSWDTNVTGTWLVTKALMPFLLKSSSPRLLFIASGTSTLAESENPAVPVNAAPPAGWPKPPTFAVPAYRSAKTGMNMMVREWARIVRNDNVLIHAVSPGWLATGLGAGAEASKKAGAIDPAIGAAFVRDVIEGKRDADAGRVIRKDDVQPW